MGECSPNSKICFAILRGEVREGRLYKGDKRRRPLYYLTLHDNNVTQFTVKHSSYSNATTSYLIVLLIGLLAYYYVIAPSPISSQIPHTLFGIISLGADAV